MESTQNGTSSSGSSDAEAPSVVPNTVIESSTACGFSKLNSPTETTSLTPASSDSAADIAASTSFTEADLSTRGDGLWVDSTVDIRGVSIVCLVGTFMRLSLVFPPNVKWSSDVEVEMAAEVYAKLLSDIPAEECKAAIALCAKTLPRFPFPADIRAAAGKQ